MILLGRSNHIENEATGKDKQLLNQAAGVSTNTRTVPSWEYCCAYSIAYASTVGSLTVPTDINVAQVETNSIRFLEMHSVIMMIFIAAHICNGLIGCVHNQTARSITNQIIIVYSVKRLP